MRGVVCTNTFNGFNLIQYYGVAFQLIIFFYKKWMHKQRGQFKWFPFKNWLHYLIAR